MQINKVGIQTILALFSLKVEGKPEKTMKVYNKRYYTSFMIYISE